MQYLKHLSAPVVLGCLLCAAAQAAQSQPRPNVVIFLADDQGWGDLSIHGNSNLSTPNIDSLAKAGARFERFFVSPVCSPTRAEFLTGRYHPRCGVHDVSTGGERLNLSEKTIADTFKPGRGQLTLRALKVAGTQVMDVRAVHLTFRP